MSTTLITVEDARARLKSIDDLPSLPTIIAEINDLMSNPKTTAPKLAEVIMKDPAITARVLKIVNSAFFGFPKRITSVPQAIVALGFNTVRSIVLCSSVMEAFSNSKTKFDALNRKDFWTYSVAVGAAVRTVARNGQLRNGQLRNVEAAFVNGLLHGVGKLVLDQYFHDQFIEALRIAREQERLLWDVEREVIGVTHADIGGILMEFWKLGDDVVSCVKYQEDPSLAPEAHRQLTASVTVGQVLARVCNLGDSGEIVVPRVSHETMMLARVEQDSWHGLLDMTVDEAKKASVFFDME